MENKSLKPKIRFKGFTEAWEQRKLGEYGTFYYGHSAPKWSVTDDATTPCIRYGEMYTKFGCKIDKVFSYTNIPKENLVFSKGTEVLIPRVGEDPLDYNHCTWLSIPGVAIGEMISVYNTEQNPLFTAIMYNATLKYEFAKRVEGGSVTNLYYDKLKDIDVSFPSKEEQEKISNFLYKIDNLITLHQRKCDKLVNIKKSLLEKMFPKNGNNVPEIRFKGFTEAWEQRKLKDISIIQAGGDVDNTKIKEDGKYPVIANALTNDGIVGYYNDEYRIKAPAVTVTGRGDVGHAQARTIDFTPVVRLLALNTKHDANFIANAINTKRIIVESTGVPQLTVPQLENYEIKITSEKEENKIGELFIKIDNLITLHQKKLNKLKNIKKSLLEKMFV